MLKKFKYKVTAALTAAVFMVGLVPATVGAVPATVGAVPASLLPADYTEAPVTTPGSPGCGVKVKHGPFSTTAVSQLVIAQAMTSCQNTSYVEIVAFNTSNSSFLVQRCYVGTGLGDTGSGSCSRFTSGTDNVYQAYVANTTLVGTKAHLCHATSGCSDYEFAPSYSIANPAHWQSPDVVIRETNDNNPNDECRVNFTHGNFSTTAISRISNPLAVGTCDPARTWVEVIAVKTTDATVHTQRCYLDGSGTCNNYSGWHQAQLSDSYIIGSTVHLCGDLIDLCETSAGDQFFAGM
jgi:hypothetical protein